MYSTQIAPRRTPRFFLENDKSRSTYGTRLHLPVFALLGTRRMEPTHLPLGSGRPVVVVGGLPLFRSRQDRLSLPHLFASKGGNSVLDSRPLHCIDTVAGSGGSGAERQRVVVTA
jgi:hypothetical protein